MRHGAPLDEAWSEKWLEGVLVPTSVPTTVDGEPAQCASAVGKCGFVFFFFFLIHSSENNIKPPRDVSISVALAFPH